MMRTHRSWILAWKGCRPSRRQLVLMRLAALALWIPSNDASGMQDDSNGRPIVSSNQPVVLDSSPQDTLQHKHEPIPMDSEPRAIVMVPGNSTDGGGPESEAEAILVRRGVDTAHREPFLRGDQIPWYRHSLISLAMVLALVGATLWGIRRLFPSLRQPVSSDAIRVVARTALTPKHQLALVECGDRTILIGVSPDRLHALGEIGVVSQQTSAIAGPEIGTASTANGRAGGFDEVLAKEHSSYVQTLGNRGAQHQPSDRSAQWPMGAAVRAPLKDLLERVRTLKL